MAKSLVAGEALGHVDPAQASREHGVAATCTEPGTAELVRRCERCGMELSRTSEATRPLGHEWTEPTYAWTPDARSVTATRTCARDEAHVEKETATVSSTVIREPSGTADGIELLAATFENSAFATQERRVTIPATGGKEGTSSETEGPAEGDGRHNKEVVVALPGVFGARPYGSGPAFGRIPGNAIFDHGPQRTWYDGGTTDELASRRSTAEVPFAGGSPTPVQTPTTSTTGTDVAPPTGVVPTTGIQATGPAVPSAATGTTAGAGVRAQTVATGKVATQSVALPGTADTSDDGLACGFVVCALAMSVAGVRRLRPERA
jgi:hypothetical protein